MLSNVSKFHENDVFILLDGIAHGYLIGDVFRWWEQPLNHKDS